MEEFVEFCPISKVLKLVKRSHTPSWEFPAKPNCFWFSGLLRKLSSGSGAVAQKPGRELEIWHLRAESCDLQTCACRSRELWRLAWQHSSALSTSSPV